MCWVIIGHSVLTFLAFGNNPADLIEAAGEVEMQLVVTAFFSVDTFFFLSGLLLTFMWFKKHAQNPRATNSLSGWMLFYVHRIARLSPAYFFVIAFYTWVFPTWLTGMPALMSDDSIVSTYCERNWWTNYLYVNNIVNYKEQCFDVSWYLAADMQMFVFAPLILIPLAMNVRVGIFVALGILCASTAGNIVTVVHYYFPATLMSVAVPCPFAFMGEASRHPAGRRVAAHGTA
ncbi:Acyltransferase family protein [Aphelenchoides avenae]|nr:Acyltransferase family protein [Aphelenchus avenae]